MPSKTSLRRLAALAAAALASAGLAATSASATPKATAASSATVTIKNIAYHPATVTITHGGTVTWRFVDPEVSHNVTSNGRKRFHSSPTKLKGTFKVKFAKKGTYTYHCTIHSNMHGKVVVR